MPKMKNTSKAAYAGGASAALTTYAAGIISARYNVPAEIAAIVAGGVFAFLGRWAAKLNPSN